ncbi:tetratricopeptide repeat protein [uncultured Chryseobacterium sp.]|uniref:tetratricopeptide repeat protein n=1 Tax=uncultured Chryseobacterium sp. TaxID=259322 RepID=UPI002629AC04|nr:tetratricopeptide repeat protein [uncultured Chryseobacterium sp.]
MMKKLYILMFAIFLGLNFISAQENYNTLVYEGNRQFEKKNYEASSSKYMAAVKLNDKDFTAHYNLANSLYKREKYEEAQAEYQKAQALAQTLPDKSAALYNLGNTYMQTNNHEKAAEFYKQALKQDPYNETIRKNYEIAKLKEKEQQNQQNQKNNGGGGGGKDKQESKDGKGEKQNGGQGGNEKGEGGENGNNPDQNKNENNGSNIPKDQQNAILNRVENKERETARKILNKNSYSMPQSNEKDW